MKTYVVMISKYAPKQLGGYQTNFVDKIINKEKKHTLRSNYEYWRQRFEKINSGEACLSLRYWQGLPYRSKQVEFLRLTKNDGIGLQRLTNFKNCVYNINNPNFTQERYNKIIQWITTDYKQFINKY